MLGKDPRIGSQQADVLVRERDGRIMGVGENDPRHAPLQREGDEDPDLGGREMARGEDAAIAGDRVEGLEQLGKRP